MVSQRIQFQQRYQEGHHYLRNLQIQFSTSTHIAPMKGIVLITNSLKLGVTSFGLKYDSTFSSSASFICNALNNKRFLLRGVFATPICNILSACSTVTILVWVLVISRILQLQAREAYSYRFKGAENERHRSTVGIRGSKKSRIIEWTFSKTNTKWKHSNSA